MIQKAWSESARAAAAAARRAKSGSKQGDSGSSRAYSQEEKEKLKIEERTRKFRDKGDVVSEDISTTTSTTLQTKTVYQFTPKETSDYVLLWTLEMANSNANGASYYQVDVNDQTVIGDGIYRPSAANYWMTISGHSIQSLTKDVTYTYKIKYRAGSNTAKIRRAKLYIVEDR